MTNKKLNPRLTGRGIPLNERKILFVGSVFETILDRTLFPSNEDLHPYAQVFEKLFKIIDKRTGEAGYRPYLFKDRTLLASRIARKITETENAETLYKAIDAHVSYLEGTNEFDSSSHRPTKKGKTTTLLEDFNKNMDDSK